MTALLLLSFLAVVSAVSAAAGETCDNGGAPNYLWLECAISPGAECYRTSVEGHSERVVDWCGSSRYGCKAYTGLELHVTCRTTATSDGDGGSSDELELVRDGEVVNGSWPFATAVLADGHYECRWKENGSLFAAGNVSVDEKVYVMPGVDPGADPTQQSFSQQCHLRVVDDFNCSLSGRRVYTHIGSYTVGFSVIGKRPIDLSVDVIWANHYPVNLDPTLSSDVARNDSISYAVSFNFDKVVFVGEDLATAYLVLTGTSGNRSSSMCVHIEVIGVAVLFPNDSLPQDTTAVTGEPAIFSCDVQTTQTLGQYLTVGFAVKLLTSDDLHTCYNCSFSSATLNNCDPPSPVKEGLCSGFVVHYAPTGHPQLQTHHLTANWTAPSSDAAVICAIASSGVTQWARTATLSVLAPSNIPSSASPRHPQLAGLAALSLLAAVGGALLLGLLLCLRRRYRHQLANSSQPPEETPLSMESLPSSGTATPTLTHPPALPAIQLDPAMVDHSRHLRQALQMYSDSQDSGLDVSTTVEGQGSKIVGNHLRVFAGCHSNSLNNLSYPPSREVCVYVSYCDSQEEWVRETLLPLLHSFQPIRVTDHEGHMIAGRVISEERLRLLSSADKVVAVVSPDYHLSDWCCYELQHVVQQSPRGAGHLVPILCGGCRELPSTIATLHPLSQDDPNWPHKLKVAIRRQHHHSS